jgi:hypothetical protein
LLVQILYKKNRIHGVCEIVDFYLNYTKFYNFLLKDGVETGLKTDLKVHLPPNLHSHPQAKPPWCCGKQY